MKLYSCLSLVLVSLICAACGDSGSSTNSAAAATEAAGISAPVQKLESIHFQGLSFPGTAASAKADGFTECKHEFNHYRCGLKEPTKLYGISAKEAFVELNAADAFATDSYSASNVEVITVSPETLSFRSVHFRFEREFDQVCVKKNAKKPGAFGEFLDPEACLVSGGIEEVVAQLSANGWHSDGSLTRVSRYYKDQEPIEIRIEHGTVELRPLGRTEAMEKWSALRTVAAEKEETASKADAFIESMKTE